MRHCFQRDPLPHRESKLWRASAANRLSFPSHASIRSSISEFCDKIGGSYRTNAGATNSKISTRPVALVSRARSSRAMFAECHSEVLFDVSHGQPTERVRDFIVQAYVRGAKCGCADRSGFENSTAVFTKRRCCKYPYGRHPNRAMFCKFAKRYEFIERVTMPYAEGTSCTATPGTGTSCAESAGRTTTR